MKMKLENITPENTALLLIDMQDHYLDFLRINHSGERATLSLIESLNGLIYACGKKDILTICLTMKGIGKVIDPLAVALEDTPRQYHLIKTRMDGFEGTDLDKILRENGILNVISAGIYYNACVNATEGGARKREIGLMGAKDITDYLVEISRGGRKWRKFTEGIFNSRYDAGVNTWGQLPVFT